MQKSKLRIHIRSLKRLMTAEERMAQSEAVCRKVMLGERWQEARVVLLYHALPDEVDTALLLNQMTTRKRVLLPVVVGDVLELREFDGRVEEGAFGILEPTAQSSLFTDFSLIDLIVVPGMAFDAQGHRLGRGKGYYDRLLCQCPRAYKMGVCFDYQLVDDVPSEPHDIRMDEVVCITVQP